jgi:hypothetical protein
MFTNDVSANQGLGNGNLGGATTTNLISIGGEAL